ncbi:MAG: carbonic anhydrase family protein [Proteobacteria bacterium]|nr:carbonic anhydrase family protein [Pseudomonadota bacterium]
MHAEMVSDAGSTGPARTLTVADGAPVSTDAKPVDKAASKGTAKITGQDVDKAGAAKGEAPRRLLELPGIDKSRVEHPVDTSNPAAAAAAAKEKDSQPRTERSERRALERAFATSGPRRMLSRKKAAEADTAKEPPRLPVHWSYEGEGGPANWARLRPDYATCDSGKRQSPIDIRDTIRVDQEPLRFDYKPTRFSIVNNGHTIQIGVGEGNTVSVMGRTYELKQFHFHKPSEEKINGRGTDMVIHLVHQDDEGHLAVVAVLLEKGTDNPLIQTLWNNLPLEENQPLTPAPAIDLTRLLPQERGYYSYMGSLTTPPCTEEVLWLVFKQPMQLSADQVSIFSRLYPRNARPVQPANDRLIKESR